MFNFNFISLPVFGYVINYFPVLNVITSSMQLITLKNNILQAIGSCSKSLYHKLNTTNKKGAKNVLINFTLSFLVCLPAIAVSLSLRDIQKIMKYLSSIFGFLLMFIVPTILVYAFRLKFKRCSIQEGKLNRSFLNKNYQLIVILAIGALTFGMVCYGFFIPNNKKCVAEPDDI
jgi:hypothetical protein